jgi:hypothetical protein
MEKIKINKLLPSSQLFRVHVCQLVVSSKLGNVMLKYVTFSIKFCVLGISKNFETW